MLRLGRKVEYGLIAIMHIARLPAGEVAAAREIAERYKIPPGLLGKVLQELKRAGVLDSTQGAKGGYRLQRPLAEIHFGEVMEALDGPIEIATCTCDETMDCLQEDTCNIKSLVTRFRLQLQDFVYNMPLSAEAINSEKENPPEFGRVRAQMASELSNSRGSVS